MSHLHDAKRPLTSWPAPTGIRCIPCSSPSRSGRGCSAWSLTLVWAAIDLVQMAREPGG